MHCIVCIISINILLTVGIWSDIITFIILLYDIFVNCEAIKLSKKTLKSNTIK